ncbi:hypothetical protein RMCBS344292_16578 [Rhizopus microsporus]|nr:hypothetical protein RMCBS344292_16578 [Rhizopus microsporus]
MKASTTPTEPKEACNCAARLHFNLPCKHVLALYPSNIPLSVILRRWRIDYNEGEDAVWFAVEKSADERIIEKDEIEIIDDEQEDVENDEKTNDINNENTQKNTDNQTIKGLKKNEEKEEKIEKNIQIDEALTVEPDVEEVENEEENEEEKEEEEEEEISEENLT